jgi:GTP-binding protein
VNDEKLLDQSYHRYLDSKLREKAPYTGLPILIHLRARTQREKAGEGRSQKFSGTPKSGPPTGPRKRTTKKADKPRRRLGG